MINFLKNPNLWNSPTVFAPIAGQRIHGERLGQSTGEIFQVLKRQFNISEKLHVGEDQELRQVIENANSILSQHFHVTDTTIYVAGIDSSEEFANKHLGGVSGYAWPNAVLLYLNPEREWPSYLLRTALHEFNHGQRYLFSDPYKSFLDWLIFEGLAEAFENEITQKSAATFETRRQLAEKHIPHLRKFWHNSPTDGYQWFFGDEKRSIPVGLGYTVGHHLVEKFRNSHPNLTWQQLIETPSQNFDK